MENSLKVFEKSWKCFENVWEPYWQRMFCYNASCIVLRWHHVGHSLFVTSVGDVSGVFGGLWAGIPVRT